MFVHMRVHKPNPGKADFVLESMRLWGAALHGQPGFLQFATMKDEKTGNLVGMATWRSREAWDACAPVHRELRMDPFTDWDDGAADVYLLSEL